MKRFLSLCMFSAFLVVDYSNAQVIDLPTKTEEYAVFPSEQKVAYVDSTIISEETIYKSEWNGWQDKRMNVSYHVVRYKDGTTTVFDGMNSWMRFKTEYVTNEYTGEKTNKFVNVEKYIDGPLNPNDTERQTTLISAKRKLPNDYDIEVSDGVLSLYYKPLGLTYSVYIGNIPSTVWKKDVNSQFSFDRFYRQYFLGYNTGKKPPVVTVKGPNGNILELLNAVNFKDAGGLIHKGGYYDNTTQKMYYIKDFSLFTIKGIDQYVMQVYSDVASPDEINKVLRPYVKQNQEFYKIWDSLKLSPAVIMERLLQCNCNINPKWGISLVYCLPSDSIKRVETNDKIVEIDYANGDYLKFSKLKEGTVYDCHVHRPNGVWTVKVNDEGKRESEFVYTSGKYKGFIYKDDFDYTEYAQCMAFPEMKIDRKRLYEPSRNRFVYIRDDGEIQEYFEERMEAERRLRSLEYRQKTAPIYQAYCQKYGKANVDEILTNNNIKVGMPLSVIKALCHCSITDQGKYGEWYYVWFCGYEYDFENNKIKPYDAKNPLANEWYIRVSNGVVDYVGYR